MSDWLLKTEPSEYNFETLTTDGRATWDGIRNGLAVKNLAQIRRGDQLLIYHTGAIKAVVGTAEAVSDAYPDPSDKKYFVVDIAPGRALKKPVTLAIIKSDGRFAGWELIRLPRLSVVPVPAQMLTYVLNLGSE
jgi:predicted RNA-binding protein with PUA-like domain